MSEAPKENWIDDACAIFDGHAKDLGWVSHIYSQNLRELVAKNDRLTSEAQAATEKAVADALREAARKLRANIDACCFGEFDDEAEKGLRRGMYASLHTINSLIPPEQRDALDDDSQK